MHLFHSNFMYLQWPIGSWPLLVSTNVSVCFCLFPQPGGGGGGGGGGGTGGERPNGMLLLLSSLFWTPGVSKISSISNVWRKLLWSNCETCLVSTQHHLWVKARLNNHYHLHPVIDTSKMVDLFQFQLLCTTNEIAWRGSIESFLSCYFICCPCFFFRNSNAVKFTFDKANWATSCPSLHLEITQL